MTRSPEPADLAPHVEAPWREAFVLELRLLDVPGTRIGDVLSEVDAHCADSGESALDAFGDPVAYARALDLPAAPAASREVRATVLGALAQVAGLFTVPSAVGALAAGTRQTVTAGEALTAVLVLTGISAFALMTGRIMRVAIERPGPSAAVMGMAVTLTVLPAAMWRSDLLTVPAPAGLAVGLTLLVVGVVVEVRALGVPDLIRMPTASTPAGDGADARRSFPWVSLLVPAATVVLAAVRWFAA